MIVLFGIAGSGKGTQAEILAKHLNCPIVSTGDLLRQNKDNPKVKAAIDSGVLVGDDVLLPLLESEFKKIAADKDEFILDGTPRNTKQAQWLVAKIKKGELKLTAIIHLLLSEEAALQRLHARARHDDSEDIIEGRFKFYEDSVLPAIDYLKRQGFEVTETDGSQSVETVATQIQSALEAKQ